MQTESPTPSGEIEAPRSESLPSLRGMTLGEVQALLAEGEEADFFEEHGELLQKVRAWLEDDEGRQRVAAAGRARLLADERTHASGLRSMLDLVLGEEEASSVEDPPAALPARTAACEVVVPARAQER